MSLSLSIFKQPFSELNGNYQSHFAAEETETRTNKEDSPRYTATSFALKQHLSDWGTQETIWVARGEKKD